MTHMSRLVCAVAAVALGAALGCSSSPVSHDTVPPVDVPIPPVDTPVVVTTYNLAGRWCGGVQGGAHMIWTASQTGQAASGPVQFVDGALQFNGSLQANLANSASVPWTMNFAFMPAGSQCQVTGSGSAPQTSDTQVSVTIGGFQSTGCASLSLPPTMLVTLTRNPTCN